MTEVVATVRMIASGWATKTKDNSAMGYFILTSLVLPIIYCTVAVTMFRAGDRADMTAYAAIGSGLLSMWTVTLVGSGQALTLLRHDGLLELLVAAPRPLALTLAPITLAAATVGSYALVVTSLWGWLVLGVPLRIERPWSLLAAVAATILALGMLGMVLASVFILYRYANAITNLLVYPVWLCAGILVPVDLLPGWAEPISWLLPSTWGARAIRDSMLGGQPLPAIGACLALAAAYFCLALLTVRHFEVLARRRASLALA